MNRDKAERIRTLRTFQVFRAAHKLDAGKQGYTARQQHREATQVHVPLPAGLRRRGVPSEMQSPVRHYRATRVDRSLFEKRSPHAPARLDLVASDEAIIDKAI